MQAVEDAAAKAGAAASRALTAAASAEESAETAATAAEKAVEDADKARKAAKEADRKAGEAGEAAEGARKSANIAQESAHNASEYAARALGNLSTVQSVTETLNWITTHGTMTKTDDYAPSTDTEVVEGKKYYSRSGSGTAQDPYVYTLISNPTGDPSAAGYYEGVLDPTHVYFVQDNAGDYEVAGVRYAIVTEPKVEDIADYYVLSIDESLNNYVATHLALLNDGLYVMADNSEWKVKIAGNGVYILDPDNRPKNTMSEDKNIIGYPDSERLESTTDSIKAYNKDNVTFFEIDYTGGSGVAKASVECTIFSTNQYRDIVSHTVQLPEDIIPGSSFSVLLSNIYAISSQAEWNEYTLGEGDGLDISYDSGAVEYAFPKAFDCVEGVSNSITYYRDATRISTGRTTTSFVSLIYNPTNNTIRVRAVAFFIGQQFYILENQKIVYITTTNAPAFVFGSNDSDIKGDYSASLGEGLDSSGTHQTVIGKYNKKDNADKYAFIVGNGNNDASRSNAMTIDWDGNVEIDMDTSAAAGTTDGDLYAAITALGWESEVID